VASHPEFIFNTAKKQMKGIMHVYYHNYVRSMFSQVWRVSFSNFALVVEVEVIVLFGGTHCDKQ
jgi:hypothetical protein